MILTNFLHRLKCKFGPLVYHVLITSSFSFHNCQTTPSGAFCCSNCTYILVLFVTLSIYLSFCGVKRDKLKNHFCILVLFCYTIHIPFTGISLRARRNNPGAIFPNLRTSLITCIVSQQKMHKVNQIMGQKSRKECSFY